MSYLKHSIAFALLSLALLALPTSALATKVLASTVAPGYNSTNASDAFFNAIIDPQWDTVIVDTVGVWNLEPMVFDTITNKVIIFQPTVHVLALPNLFGTHDCLLQLRDCSNLELVGYGATLEMQKPEYINNGYRHCLSIRSCSNIDVRGFVLKRSGGDGIYIGLNSAPSYATGGALPYSEHITIRDCICDDNKRQGLSIASARHVTVEDCEFINTNGICPASGIDIEPNDKFDDMVDIVFRRCRMTGNEGHGILVTFVHQTSASDEVNVRFDDCYIANNRPEEPKGTQHCTYRSQVSVQTTTDAPNGQLYFERCLIEDSWCTGFRLEKPANTLSCTLTDCAIKNAGYSNEQYQVPVLLDDVNDPMKHGGIWFDDLLVDYTANEPWLDVCNCNGGTGIDLVGGTVTISNPHMPTANTSAPGYTVVETNYAALPVQPIKVEPWVASVNEGNEVVQAFRFKRTGPRDPWPLPVMYDVLSSATEGEDIGNLPNFIMIPPKERKAYARINAVPDNDVSEGNEAVTLDLQPSTCYTIGTPGTATLTITDGPLWYLKRKPVGPSTMSATPLHVFPNPASEHVRVMLPEELQQTGVEVEVLNALGAVVLRQRTQPNATSALLPVHTLPKGLYVLRMNGSTAHTARLVVQ